MESELVKKTGEENVPPTKKIVAATPAGSEIGEGGASGSSSVSGEGGEGGGACASRGENGAASVSPSAAEINSRNFVKEREQLVQLMGHLRHLNISPERVAEFMWFLDTSEERLLLDADLEVDANGRTFADVAQLIMEELGEETMRYIGAGYCRCEGEDDEELGEPGPSTRANLMALAREGRGSEGILEEEEDDENKEAGVSAAIAVVEAIEGEKENFPVLTD